MDKTRIVSCWVLGAWIPAMSFLLAHVGGDIMNGVTEWDWKVHWLGPVFLLLGATVLAVSLSHIAESFQIIMNCQKWQSWALACAMDLALVSVELGRVTYDYFNTWSIAIMVCVMGGSAWMNIQAFLRHAETDSTKSGGALF